MLKQRLLRPGAYRQYRELLRTQYLPAEELAALGWRRRLDLLHHAYETVPYYRRRLDEAGLRPADLRTPEDWQQLPALTRQEVIDHRDELLSRQARPDQVALSTTGGSTGTPVTTYQDRRYPSEVLMWRLVTWWGLAPGGHAAHSWRLTRRSRAARLANALLWWPTRRLWLDATAMTPGQMRSFLTDFNRLRPPLLQGYVGAIHHLASFIEEEGLPVHSPGAVWLTAAPVSAVERALVQRVFHAPVYDQYGCCEVGCLAAQCAAGGALHLNADVHHVEFVREDGAPCAPGEYGRILVTDTTNRAFPLLRYELGDSGRALPGACSCGRTLPLMDAVRGRVTDMVRLPDRSVLGGDTLTTIFDDFPEAVRAFQVVQERDLSLVLRVVPNHQNPQANPLIDGVLQTLRTRTRGLVPVSLEVVEALESDRGKTRYVISHATP